MARFAIALMLALTPSAAMAQGARACLTPVEAEALVQYALPDIIGQIGTTCAATLPGTAYLIRSRADLVKRYTRAAAPALPVARGAFAKIAGIAPEQLDKMGDDALRGLLGMGIGAAISGKFQVKDCGMVDQVVELMAPLPPENVARLIGVVLRQGNKTKKDDTAKPSALRLCDGQEGA